MNDLRSPMEDRPYRPAERANPRMSFDDDADMGDTMSTAEYYRSRFDAVRQSRWFPIASVFAAVLVFSGVISYAYKQGAQTGVNATTPIVEATETAYKEKPENPGGMDVPFQDAIVFDQLQSKDNPAAGESIESLLPPPEQPVATETADNTTNAPATTPAADAAAVAPETVDAILEQPAEQKTVSDIPSVTAEKTTTAAPSATETALAEPAAAAAKAQEAAKLAEKKAAEQKLAAQKAAEQKLAEERLAAQRAAEQNVAKKMDQVAPAAAPPAATAVESGSYRIQLGAFRDLPAAQAAWSQFQKNYAGQLSNVTPDFPRADLGAKGVFYRVQGKNLSKNAADSICGSINAIRSGSCMVTQ